MNGTLIPSSAINLLILHRIICASVICKTEIPLGYFTVLVSVLKVWNDVDSRHPINV